MTDQAREGALAVLADFTPDELIGIFISALTNREEVEWQPKSNPERDRYYLPAPNGLAKGYSIEITPDMP